MPRKELTIRLGARGAHVTVDLLIDTLENTLTILRSLAREASPSGKPVKWEIVRASMRSPLTLTLAPESDTEEEEVGARVIPAYMESLREIGNKRVPDDFAPEALEAAKELVGRLRGNGAAQLMFSAPDEESVTLTKERAEEIVEAVSRGAIGAFHDLATIEGRLEALSTHERDSFSIWEVLTKNRITCNCTPEQLEQAKGLLRRRVAVYGRVGYNRKGKLVSIEVQKIRELREQSQLPQPKDIGKVDITGGLSSEDFIRGLRDGT